MKYLLAFLFTLAFLPAHADFYTVPEKTRDITNNEITEALHAHYDSLSANEQWGVGMGCTLGRMQSLVKEAQVLKINTEKGIIFAAKDPAPNLLHGQTKYEMVINFKPGTQEILKVAITAISEDGLKRSCSTRNPLIKLAPLENLLSL